MSRHIFTIFYCLFILYPCLILTAGPEVPSEIIEAFAGSTSAVVFVAVMIMIILIVLFVVLKKRQRQKDYEIPPQNTELQESIMIKNNAIK